MTVGLAKTIIPVIPPTLSQLATNTGFNPEMLLKAQRALFQLPGAQQMSGITTSVRIPTSWQIVGHLLALQGSSAPSKDTSLKGEQRAQFNFKVASSRGAVQISARIVFRRRGSFLTTENSKALIQIVVRVINGTGIQEHRQEIFLSCSGDLKVRNKSGSVEEQRSTRVLLTAKEIPREPETHGGYSKPGLVPVYCRAIVPSPDC